MKPKIFKLMDMVKLFLIAGAVIAPLHILAQWEPDVRLTDSPDSSMIGWNYQRCIETTGDTVHIVWSDNRGGFRKEVYYKRSADGGITWGDDIRLTEEDNAASTVPSVAVSGQVVQVVWRDVRDNYPGEIYYKKSMDGGATWGDDQRLTNDQEFSAGPVIAAYGSVVHVMWFYPGKIYYIRSDDMGITWSPKNILVDEHWAQMPSISVCGLMTHVVWCDKRDETWQIFYKQSPDGGISWGEDVKLSDGSSTSWYPSVSASGSYVHVVWDDYLDWNDEIYYARSADNGITWSSEVRLTEDLATSGFPNIKSSGPVVHIVWQDTRNGYNDVFYKNSQDNGISWGSDYQLNDFSYDLYHPFIAVSGPIVHSVWSDFRDDNYEIYYKRNPTAGFPVTVENNKVDNEGKKFMIYPNPADDWLKIVSTGKYCGSIEMIVTDIFGKTVLSRQYKEAPEYSIDVSFLSPGCYNIMIKNKDAWITRKLLIIH